MCNIKIQKKIKREDYEATFKITGSIPTYII